MKIKHSFLLPLLVFLLTAGAALWNIGGYPIFEADEGTYVSQAWWLVNFHKLAPYIYWYDHPPLGWLQIGLWQKLTGGPFSFDFSIDSGRILMALVAGLTNIFLYLTAKKLTGKTMAGLTASFIFAFSPLNVFFHRQVLLDNLETFWLVISLYFLVRQRQDLADFLLSGIFWGLAFLSKEMALVVLPVYIFVLFREAKADNRQMAIFLWLVSAGFLVFLFPLLAGLKAELWPGAGHISLWETVLFQIKRGSGVPAWEKGSQFRFFLAEWLRLDALLMIAGLWSILVNLLDKRFGAKVAAFLSLSYLLFLCRGGLVIRFYIIPLLAFFSLSLGMALARLEKWLRKPMLALVFFGLLLLVFYLENPKIYAADYTKNQKAAAVWIKKNLNPKSFIVIDDSLFLDLQLPNKFGPGFTNAEWFSKVESEQEIREGKLANDWRKIDYILLNYEIADRINAGDVPFVARAFERSQLIQDFSEADKPFVSVAEVNREGNWQTLFKVDQSLTFPQ